MTQRELRQTRASLEEQKKLLEPATAKLTDILPAVSAVALAESAPGWLILTNYNSIVINKKL